MRIAGAGWAGLLAAHAWPSAPVFEVEREPRNVHRALLRFRSTAVSELTGIEFAPVTVRKGIWCGGEFVAPSIRIANLYAQKVTGGSLVGDRSIWNLDAVQRFIAPEDFYEQLIGAVGKRIHWGEPCDFAIPSSAIVSTVPLPVVLRELGLTAEPSIAEIPFTRQPIAVARYRVDDCHIHQTIYFPSPETLVYRASITGDLLIVEMQHSISSNPFVDEIPEQVLPAFGISPSRIRFIDAGDQRYGKIVPLADSTRKALLNKLSRDHGVFSLGRFATWRGILLDDVVHDIAIVRRLLRASNYERALLTA